MSPSSLQHDSGPQQLISLPATFSIPQSTTPGSSSLPNLSVGNQSKDEPRVQRNVSRSVLLGSPKVAAALSATGTQSQDRFGTPNLTTPLSSLKSEQNRNIIIQSFAPRIAVYASFDTENFARHKGFHAGFTALLRPFGETVQGNVVVRDSTGGSRAYRDFGVRFFDPLSLEKAGKTWLGGAHEREPSLAIDSPKKSQLTSGSSSIEEVLDLYVEKQIFASSHPDGPDNDEDPSQAYTQQLHSPLFQLYLRRLLSDSGQAPYETFGHPVACLIAVSSRNEAPVESLRQLYTQSNADSSDIPPWIGNGCLRYYVLVHDEENDNIAQSTALFELMKRHFGLHCYLLRLRSSQCIMTDDDSTAIPPSVWLSTKEELEEMQRNSE